MRPGASVVNVAGKTLLTAVEIDGGDALAGLQPGNGDVKCGGGFSRTAFSLPRTTMCAELD